MLDEWLETVDTDGRTNCFITADELVTVPEDVLGSTDDWVWTTARDIENAGCERGGRHTDGKNVYCVL